EHPAEAGERAGDAGREPDRATADDQHVGPPVEPVGYAGGERGVLRRAQVVVPYRRAYHSHIVTALWSNTDSNRCGYDDGFVRAGPGGRRGYRRDGLLVVVHQGVLCPARPVLQRLLGANSPSIAVDTATYVR